MLTFLFGWFLLVSNTYAITLRYPVDPSLYVPGSYGNRFFFAGQDHLGEDISLSEGTPVKAIGDGTIVFYGPQSDPNVGYGELVVVIEHDLGKDYAFINAYGKIVITRKVLSIAGHLRTKRNRGDAQGLLWKEGQTVKAGDVIGYVNNSSHPDGQSIDPNGDGLEHLHQGIRLSDKATAAQRDPKAWYRGYELSTDFGTDFASAELVIEIVNNGGIQSLCSGLSSSGNGICWAPSSASDVSCVAAKSWTVYQSFSSVIVVNSNQYCPTTEISFSPYGSTGPVNALGGGGVPSSSFDLKINNHWVRDAATGYDLVPGGHTVRTNQVLEVRNQVKAVNGDTHDYMRPGKDRIENDFWVQEDDNEWRFIGREYIQATNLPNGATHTEHVYYTVPPGISQVRFKVKIDAEDEASESNEGNNWSKVIAFTVDNNPYVNFVATYIGLTNTPNPVPTGSAMRVKTAIRNIGTTAPSVGIRTSYSYRPLGSTGPWTQVADDGSDPQDLVPNQDHWEETLSAVVAPLVPGWYELRSCPDYQNAVLESNEADNCLTTTFEVVPPRPDFTITAVGPAGGKTAFKAGTRIYPAMYIKNIGNANPTSGIRSAYYYQGPATGGAWVYITDDGTDANQLCVGCQYREQYDGGMKISVRGTYYFKGCADYLGWQTESDETNNCTVSAPITIY